MGITAGLESIDRPKPRAVEPTNWLASFLTLVFAAVTLYLLR